MAKELRTLCPAELPQLFEGVHPVPVTPATAAVLRARALDVSSLDEQRAAVRKREEAVAMERAAVQRLVVHIACMAKGTQQDVGVGTHGTPAQSKRLRLAH